MAENTSERVSALLDDELKGGEDDLLVRRLSKDAALRGRWRSYSLIGAALRGTLPERFDMGLSERVSVLIEREPAHDETTVRSFASTRFARPLAGLAIAASIALLALVGLRSGFEEEPALNPVAALQSSGVDPRLATVQWSDAAPEMRSRLGRYFVIHNERAAHSAMPGVLPYVRMVGLEPTR